MDEYEQNLINLIKDIRTDLSIPNLPVVVANSGMGGLESFPDAWVQDMQNQVAPAQQAATEFADFAGTVALADTRPFWRDAENSPSEGVHHWNDNAWTYLNIGQESAIQMIELLGKNETTNVQESLNAEEIKLYPNPTGRYLSSESFAEAREINIYNILGSKVKTIQSESNQIDLNGLDSGVYILELKIEGKSVSRRVVKE